MAMMMMKVMMMMMMVMMAMIVGRLGCALSRLLIDQIAGLDSCLPFNELGTHDDDDDDHYYYEYDPY